MAEKTVFLRVWPSQTRPGHWFADLSRLVVDERRGPRSMVVALTETDFDEGWPFDDEGSEVARWRACVALSLHYRSLEVLRELVKEQRKLSHAWAEIALSKALEAIEGSRPGDEVLTINGVPRDDIEGFSTHGPALDTALTLLLSTWEWSDIEIAVVAEWLRKYENKAVEVQHKAQSAALVAQRPRAVAIVMAKPKSGGSWSIARHEGAVTWHLPALTSTSTAKDVERFPPRTRGARVVARVGEIIDQIKMRNDVAIIYVRSDKGGWTQMRWPAWNVETAP